MSRVTLLSNEPILFIYYDLILFVNFLIKRNFTIRHRLTFQMLVRDLIKRLFEYCKLNSIVAYHIKFPNPGNNPIKNSTSKILVMEGS